MNIHDYFLFINASEGIFGILDSIFGDLMTWEQKKNDTLAHLG